MTKHDGRRLHGSQRRRMLHSVETNAIEQQPSLAIQFTVFLSFFLSFCSKSSQSNGSFSNDPDRRPKSKTSSVTGGSERHYRHEGRCEIDWTESGIGGNSAGEAVSYRRRRSTGGESVVEARAKVGTERDCSGLFREREGGRERERR